MGMHQRVVQPRVVYREYVQWVLCNWYVPQNNGLRAYSLSYRAYSLSYRKYSGLVLWFKSSIVTSSCHVCLKTIEGYRMLQSNVWVVLSVWYYIFDWIWAQCGGENFTVCPLPTRNRLREKLSLSDQQGTFTTVVVCSNHSG